MTMREHIEQLATELDTRISWLPAHDWASAQGLSSQESIIWVAPPEGLGAERNYWVALHELGHVALKHPGYHTSLTIGPDYLVTSEAEAWAWALDRATVAPESSGFWAAFYGGMMNYVRSYGRVGYGPAWDRVMAFAA